MAEKSEKKPAEADPAHGAAEAKEKKKGGGLLTKMPVLLGGAMIIEAAVLFAGFKFLGGAPKPAAADTVDTSAADSKDPKADDKSQPVDLPVVADFRSPNKVSGRTFLYDVSIFVSVKGSDADKVKQMITDRGPLIQDRIRTIIAQSDPEKLGGGSEPGLETLRRQVKFQLDDVLGPGLVQEVLVPQCIPFRADF
jgi:flagellar basal body-associated protein FliL